MFDDENEDQRFRVREGGGRKRPDNPFDELMRIIQQFFKGWGRGPGNGKGGTPFSTESPKFLLFVGIAILGLVGVFTSFYTIDVSEEGVITRFGQYSRTLGSGLHFKLPFFIERIQKVPSKVRLQEEFGFRSAGTRGEKTSYNKQAYGAESLMLTGDLNVADVEWIVQYRIADPWKFLFKGRNPKRTLRDVSMSIMRRVVGDRLVGDVLTVGRVEIADKAKQLTQEVLDQYDIGIRIETVMLQDVNPPEPVKPAFNEVNEAKQEQEQAVNNAEREYNKIIPEARGRAQRTIADAQAYAINAVNVAKGDAEKFRQVLSEYRKAPIVTRQRMFLETMEEVFGNLKGITIVDSKVKGILPLYGSLGDESQKRSQVPEEPKTSE